MDESSGLLEQETRSIISKATSVSFFFLFFPYLFDDGLLQASFHVYFEDRRRSSWCLNEIAEIPFNEFTDVRDKFPLLIIQS